MTELHKLEYMVLRYVPDVVKGEFVNLGVILVEQEKPGAGFADVKFVKELGRLPLVDPEIEIKTLIALQSDIRAGLNSLVEDCSKGGEALSRHEWFLRTCQDSFSNALQVSDAKAIWAADPAAELDRLMKTYCEPTQRVGRTREDRASGRSYIVSRMTDEFQRVNAWELMAKEIEASVYTGKGDPLKIDCGYKIETRLAAESLGIPAGLNSITRLFHGVSLKQNTQLAKVLAFSWPRLYDGIARVKESHAVLTAVVEDDLDRGTPEVEFALNTMLENMTVRYVSQLPEIADVARREMEL